MIPCTSAPNDAAILPHGDGSGLPAITQGKAGAGDPAGQVSEQQLALLDAQLDDAPGEMLVDEQDLSPRLWMHPDHGVYVHGFGTPVRLGVMQRRQAFAQVAQGRRKLLEGLVEIRPERISSHIRTFHHLEDRDQGGLG